MAPEERILAKTYRDRLRADRGQTETDPDGESLLKYETVYDSVPCALSFKGAGKPEKDGIRRTSDQEMTIFAAPDIILKDMDRVEILTKAGQIFKGHSGRTVSYEGSHGETTLFLEDMA